MQKKFETKISNTVIDLLQKDIYFIRVSTKCSVCCCCWLSGVDWFLSHHNLRPSGPVLNPYPHNGVCECICTRPRCPHMCILHMHVLWAVFVQFILVCQPCLPSTTLAIPSQPTHTGWESVDQWSRVPNGTVVEQIAPISAVMNATSVHSLQRTTPNPLSCPGSTPCVSSQSPPLEPSSDRLCQPCSACISCVHVFVCIWFTFLFLQKRCCTF